MPEEDISGIYAMALFRVAERAGLVDEWGDCLARIADDFSRVKNLRIFLSSPAIPRHEKNKLIGTIADKSGFPRQVTAFIRILVEKRKINLIGRILTEYRTLADHYFKRMDVLVESALALTQDEKNKVEEVLARILESTLSVEYSVSPELIGGLKIRAGERIFDGSIDGRIERMARQIK